MLSGGYGWQLFFYVEFAFAVSLLIAAFFLVEESRYKRKVVLPVEITAPRDEKPMASQTEIGLETSPPLPPRKTLSKQLSIWSGVDREAPFFLTMVRCFTYLLVPSMFW